MIDDVDPSPSGDLFLRTTALPKDTNAFGDIYGGWLMEKMDLAGTTLAEEIAEGRVVAAAVQGINFIRPVKTGSNVSVYCDVESIGKASIEINIEVWVSSPSQSPIPLKAADGRFYYVAIDSMGKTRRVPR